MATGKEDVSAETSSSTHKHVPNRLNPEGRRTVDLRQDYSPGLIMPYGDRKRKRGGFPATPTIVVLTAYQLVFEVDQPEKHGGVIAMPMRYLVFVIGLELASAPS